MSAWAEIVTADGSDEWLEKCEAALLEVQHETRRRAAEKIRLRGSAHMALGHIAWPFGEAADLIDPDKKESADGAEAGRA